MKHIFKAWPSIRAMARDLGLEYTTVFSWKSRNRIPFEHHDAVVLACSRRGVAVTHKELKDAALSGAAPEGEGAA